MRQIRLRSSTLAFALCCATLMPAMAQAATIIVTGPGSAVAVDGECSLVEAIIAANSDTATDECPAGDPGLDTIELTGDVALTTVIDTIEGPTGLPSVTSEIVINGNGLEVRRSDLTIDEFRIFRVAYDGNLTLNDVTVSNGDVPTNRGGGIYIATLASGSGILSLVNSTVTGNEAEEGGGISNSGTLAVTYERGLSLTGSTVSGNTASLGGGGISNHFGRVQLTNSTVSGNTSLNGGGIFNKLGRVELRNSVINNNTAEKGSGIENYGKLDLFNTTVSGNKAVTSGSGIYNALPTLSIATFTNSTITDNSGSGIWNDPSTTVETRNTIIALNRSGPDCSGPIDSQGHNLDSDGSCSFTVSGDLSGIAPLLGPLQDNGGPTLTHALLSGSPAIDAGNNTGCQIDDQRGVTRPMDGNGDGNAQCDIGAFELLTAQYLAVNSMVDAVDAAVGNGLCETGGTTSTGEPECTLRAAIQESNSLAERRTINLPEGIYHLTITGAGENAAATGDLDITHDLVILGAGRGLSIIDGNGIDRVFDILGPIEVAISNATIRNGDAGGDDGGGIANQSSLTLGNVTVSGNEALSGGGISNAGRLMLTNSTVSANSGSQYGGGIHSLGVETISGSTISGNTTGESGGGISNFGALTLSNSTVSGNEAGVSGGGVFNLPYTIYLPYYSAPPNVALLNSTITDNSNSGIWNDPSAVVEIENTLIAQNRSGQDCDGPLISLGHNLASDGSCGLSGPGDLPNTAPRLDSLQDNGGPTLTHALLPGSPAIDGGDNAGCPANDQRGVPRPIDGNGDGNPLCDIGSYESWELPLQPNSARLEIPAAADYPDNPLLAYVMLGSPLILDDPAPLAVLDPFGERDAFTWRLFHEDTATQQQIEFLGGNSTDFNFERGRGYWLVANEGGTLELTGTPGDPAQPFTFHLEPGWNQITTPFNLNIDWSGCVDRPNSVNDELKGYDGSRGGFFNVSDGIMRPLQGYLVHADSHATLSIPAYCAVPTTRSARSEAKSNARAQFSATDSAESGWRLKLSVAVGRTRDVDNYLGVNTAARDGADALDSPEPPPMQGLSLYFPHPEWNTPWPYYATDIRSARSDRPQTWSFLVWSGLPDSRVELRWEHLGALPEGVVLLDMEANRLIPVDKQGLYTFDGGAGGVRHFEVSVP